jgi:phosphonate degradation associated HDIG domain protein
MSNEHADLPNDDAAVQTLLDQLRRGQTRRYPGEPVSHWEHALQTAGLALQAKASAALVTAALLHDIGHLDEDIVDTPSSLLGHDDRHEVRGARRLDALFGPAVSEPVRLHVQAKRYLVATSRGYGERLSDDSQRSLALQGGPMTAEECRAFIEQPHADDALRLRCWDDLAKDDTASAHRLERFMPSLQAALAQRRTEGREPPIDR